MRRWILIAGLAFTVSACASAASAPVTAAAGDRISEGRALAEARCASCHAIDSTLRSPRDKAPSFRELRVRFNGITWRRTMDEIAKGGHDEMPALALETRDVEAVEAYIKSLR